MAVEEKHANKATNGAQDRRRVCALPPQPTPALPPDLHPGRASAIRLGRTKWANGTVLHYWFFDGPDPQKDAVRKAFAEWKGLGIGLVFGEVQDAAAAEVRVAFDQNDGSWSYVGRDILGEAATKPTMNYGWDLTDDYGHTTALHEIGHALGMPHEHQNPFAGIVWNEEAVYADLGAPPNNWSREMVFNNVLKKLSTSEVEGSTWDPNSVMEYDFGPGLIVKPEQFSAGLHPKGGLSDTDKEWIKKWYPADQATRGDLQPFQSMPVTLKDQEQADFSLEPDATREYTIATFGASDVVLTLFEATEGDARFVAGHDDSGTEENAHLQVKLFAGHKYIVRMRLYWAGGSGTTAVMYW